VRCHDDPIGDRRIEGLGHRLPLVTLDDPLTNSPVPTGTVDLLTTTVYRSMACLIPRATASTALRSV